MRVTESCGVVHSLGQAAGAARTREGHSKSEAEQETCASYHDYEDNTIALDQAAF